MTAAELPDGAVVRVRDPAAPGGQVWQKYAPPGVEPRYWHWTGLGLIDDPHPDSRVQADMDRHGFDVLWPKDNDWRDILAPGLSRGIPDAELARRIRDHVAALEAENERLLTKYVEVEPPPPGRGAR